MASIFGDIGNILGANITAKNSTSRKNNTELNMEDFLQLMIVQLQSQTLDDTMDTSEMMNQLVQMQMISAITNMTEVNVQSYANSLVGQIVTVGTVNGNVLEERVIEVMGTGTYNGEQVIFGSDGNMYYLRQIMARGVMPDENGNYPNVRRPGSSSGCDCCGGSANGSGSDNNTDVEVDPDLDPDFGVDHDVDVDVDSDIIPDMGIDPDPNPEYGGTDDSVEAVG